MGGLIISELGGTRVCIGGPTGAFIVILYGIGAKYGLDNLAICTVMAGIMLLLLGFARLGSMIKFIPYPVTMGFTSGIAGFLDGLGRENVCNEVDHALARAREILASTARNVKSSTAGS